MAVIPQYLDNAHYNMEDFLAKSYPALKDCSGMSKQIDELQKDYDELTSRIFNVNTSSAKLDLTIGPFINHQKNLKITRARIGELLDTRRNQFTLMDCAPVSISTSSGNNTPLVGGTPASLGPNASDSLSGSGSTVAPPTGNSGLSGFLTKNKLQIAIGVASLLVLGGISYYKSKSK